MLAQPNIGANLSSDALYYDKDKDELGALLYITVVIGVFAMSVMVLVGQYIRSIRHEENNKYLINLMQRLEAGFDPRRKLTGKLALSALNIANKCVIDERPLQSTTFV
ncbi:hypothetical protein EB796_007700 [Bugula neritina]|uniref:Uncharacterized protein n=1 Tax=Bugula neritina TaxID=10212 RepID=A0A7J7K8P0_BUGNE|nr:hypothetical protein EB796_007700 [Bugula neritina]